MEPTTMILIALAIVAVLVCIPHMISRARGIKSDFEADVLLALASLFLGGIWYIVLIGFVCFADPDSK